ncbi:MAG: ParA family protein [Chloroflexota bacterium]|nr:ParA family protein [Chloroflexota bacterium]
MTDVPAEADAPIPLRDAAEQYGATYARLQKAAHDGRLVVDRRIGKNVLVRPSEVQRFLRENGRTRASQSQPSLQEAPLGKIITITTLKGGTGKTTTTFNLGAAFAEQGKRVLMIDIDPQANLTQLCGLTPAPEPTLATAIMQWLRQRAKTLDQTIVETSFGPHAQLVPASLLLSRVERELLHAPRREYVLQELLEDVAPRYDVVLIDTPPSASDLVNNALVAAHEVIIPVIPEPLPVSGLQYSIEDVAKIRETKLNPNLQIRGVLITKVDRRRAQHREAVPQLREAFAGEVHFFDTIIGDATRIVEAQGRQRSVLQYDPSGASSQAYRALVNEVMHEWQPAA